jgi:methylated-DNA-[protein]-cysteine S-methyltransferase
MHCQSEVGLICCNRLLYLFFQEEKMQTYKYRQMKTPVGNIYLVGDGECVSGLFFTKTDMVSLRGRLEQRPQAYPQAVREIEEYFAGQRTEFAFPVSLFVQGFSGKVLNTLRRVGFGQTVSYKELARRAGSPRAYRAAGGACARNPLPIVIPCHRVTNADGRIGGWSGKPGVKEKLLELESRLLAAKGKK